MLINALVFNLMWFGCIYWGNPFSLLVPVWAVLHLRFSRNSKLESRYVLLVTILGTTIDSLLMNFGVFDFAQTGFIVPFWLIMIWLSFALTLNSSLKFLQRHTLIQFLAGAVFPPLSYFAGYALGAVSFGYSTLFTLLLLSLIWSQLMVLLFRLNTWIGVNKGHENNIHYA
ncbi:DUF2878 domain-containing protein [Thalassomonas viridans]|uniref:DUF2878 domain-containing protein n=1 Tax=Thalassomonas viridans TaxID=137584 RepID=A0AAE9Z190_9GAMM|nr:DUF2878 domain-containing protein [Thalassomonas viridans]WDE04190.1 DUF2878 domain-containing protein [Thalassomonas viridans]